MACCAYGAYCQQSDSHVFFASQNKAGSLPAGMAARGGYVNGRYVSASEASKGKGKGGGRGGGGDKGGGQKGWGSEDKWERPPGDEDVTLETKFDIEIMAPGETRMGYLFNMKQTRHYDEGGRTLTGLVLYFVQRDGVTFRCTFLYRPYFFVQVDSREGLEQMKDILQQRFARDGVTAEIVDKEDLDLEDHIVGRQRKVIKLTFDNDNGLGRARKDLMMDMKRAKKPDTFSFDSASKKSNLASVATVVNLYEHDVGYVNRVAIDNYINCGKWFEVTRNLLAVSVDNLKDTQCTVKALDDYTKPPGLRIFAWDIECTKEPLKFPDSAFDRITMISIMIDGSGFLIVNRAEVSADIEPLEYTPKPEYEGIFDTFNEPDEASLLRRFFSLIRETRPHVMVSFNGDFFDHPFVDNRAKAYSMDWIAECGIQKHDGNDFYAGQWIIHMDAFNWVQRDSYLPCGARGLKAVTRYKLKYDPV
jgi:DNA polymerase epsilon subunit 1